MWRGKRGAAGHPAARWERGIKHCQGAQRVERKYFGSFSERAFWMEFTRINAGAEWVSTTGLGRRLIVVLSGAGTVAGTKFGRLAAIQAEPGERLQVNATEETVLYTVGLPSVQVPAIPSDQFDIEISDGAIQFESPARPSDRQEPQLRWMRRCEPMTGIVFGPGVGHGGCRAQQGA